MSAVEEVEIGLDPNAPVIMTISSGGIKAEFEGKNGRKVYKNIGLASMSKILNRDTEFDSGMLPLYGRNYMGIRRYIKAADREILFIEASSTLKTIKHGYDRDDLEELSNVRLPGLLMTVVLRTEGANLRVSDTRLFSLRAPIMRDTDQICRFPLGNVYQPDGRICWGSAERDLSGIKSVNQAGGLLDSFLFSAMNDDLYGSGTTRTGTDVISHLRSLQDLTDYPYEELKNEMNFKDLLSLLKSKNVR